jgi:hypothetical protein
MTLEEIIEQYGFGVKVRRKSWGSEEWAIVYGLTPNGLGYAVAWADNSVCHWSRSTVYSDFELYTEPKKKKKMWKWLVQFEKQRPEDTKDYFESEDEVKEALDDDNWKVLKRLDYTEIEVNE